MARKKPSSASWVGSYGKMVTRIWTEATIFSNRWEDSHQDKAFHLQLTLPKFQEGTLIYKTSFHILLGYTLNSQGIKSFFCSCQMLLICFTSLVLCQLNCENCSLANFSLFLSLIRYIWNLETLEIFSGPFRQREEGTLNLWWFFLLGKKWEHTKGNRMLLTFLVTAGSR